MADLSFPLNPTLYQTYTANGKTWYWDGKTWIYGSGPGLPDPNFASVVGLYHMGSADPTKGLLLDASSRGNHMTMYSRSVTNQLNGAVPGPFDPLSFVIDGGNSISGAANTWTTGADSQLGTSDFTIEGWSYPTSNAGAYIIYEGRSAASQAIPTIYAASGLLTYYQSTADRIVAGSVWPLNAWHHWHVTRNAGTTYMGRDGAQAGADYVDATNYNGGGGYWSFGTAFNQTSSFLGRLSEFRITKGIARYARTYTVPTRSFPNY